MAGRRSGNRAGTSGNAIRIGPSLAQVPSGGGGDDTLSPTLNLACPSLGGITGIERLWWPCFPGVTAH